MRETDQFRESLPRMPIPDIEVETILAVIISAFITGLGHEREDAERTEENLRLVDDVPAGVDNANLFRANVSITVEQSLQKRPHQVCTRPKDPLGHDLRRCVVPKAESHPEMPARSPITTNGMPPMEVRHRVRQPMSLHDRPYAAQLGRCIDLQFPGVAGSGGGPATEAITDHKTANPGQFRIY